jgi:site-specific recombinase XerD
VRNKLEIYDYDRRIATILERINNSQIDKNNKVLILDFYSELLTRGLSKGRVFKYLYTLHNIAKILKKPFAKTTKNDIAELIRELEGRNYAGWTKHDYKVVLKVFFRWLKKSEEYPDEVKWVKTTVRNHNTLPEEVLTEDDVRKLVESATNLRDKAFILVLYESGCRIGEILTLRIRNVRFDDYGAILIVSGKTGDRRVRIIASAPKLAQWLENHPLKNKPEAPLWVVIGTRNRGAMLSYAAAKATLKKTAKRAGLKKRIYPHLFRHSRATFLANFLTEAQLKQHFGWVQSSDMASVYVHLSGRDVDNTLLKLQGIKTDKQEKEVALKTVLCQRCNEKNSPSSKFCMRCGSPLDLKTAIQLDETRAKADKLMSALIKDPDILDTLLSKLEVLSA